MSASHERPRQQNDVLAGSKLVGVLVATVAFSLLCIGVATLLLRAREQALHPGARWPDRHLNPPHTVQGVRQHLFRDYDEAYLLHEAQRRALDHYQWVDRKAGTVTIPIERAYELLLSEEGAK